MRCFTTGRQKKWGGQACFGKTSFIATSNPRRLHHHHHHHHHLHHHRRRAAAAPAAAAAKMCKKIFWVQWGCGHWERRTKNPCGKAPDALGGKGSKACTNPAPGAFEGSAQGVCSVCEPVGEVAETLRRLRAAGIIARERL
ncbi:hypothetical protein Q7P37_004503 [Cladosporium fusiforme]